MGRWILSPVLGLLVGAWALAQAGASRPATPDTGRTAKGMPTMPMMGGQGSSMCGCCARMMGARPDSAVRPPRP
mgnify:CR=1 FL=1|jgi:hypothetical protein